MTVATASAGLLSTNVGERVTQMGEGGIGQIRCNRNKVRPGIAAAPVTVTPLSDSTLLLNVIVGGKVLTALLVTRSPDRGLICRMSDAEERPVLAEVRRPSSTLSCLSCSREADVRDLAVRRKAARQRIISSPPLQQHVMRHMFTRAPILQMLPVPATTVELRDQELWPLLN